MYACFCVFSVRSEQVADGFRLVSESASWSDLLSELRRQEFVILWVQLVEVLWYASRSQLSTIVHGTERNCLVRAGKDLNGLTRWLLNDRSLILLNLTLLDIVCS